MADKDEKKADAKKEEKPADPNEKAEKKSKLVLFAGIGGVLLVALGVGGFFIFKTLSAKKNVELAAGAPSADSHGAPVADSHGAPVADSHGAPPAADSHGAPPSGKKDEKKDDHGAKKEEPKKADPNKKDEHGAAAGGAKKEEPKGTANFGDTFLVPRLDLNLGNSVENRFIRISVGIEYRGGENQGFELKKREAQLKDIIIQCVTNKTRLALISENGKENLRREILNRINEVTDRPVQNVFFTEFFVE